jgi:inner membrane protein
MRRRTLAIGCVATIAVADFVIHRRTPRWLAIGLYDEPAHLATAALVLLNAPPQSRRTAAAFLAGSLLIDADHVPLALADEQPTEDDPRPPTHTLLIPALLAAAGQRALAAGICAHYARDLVSGPGVPVLWPLTRRELKLPYPAYALGVVALGMRALRERATVTNGL